MKDVRTASINFNNSICSKWNRGVGEIMYRTNREGLRSLSQSMLLFTIALFVMLVAAYLR